ncbi:MAG TPA: PLP-dependent aspartate aminotransferase family protein [Bryobacteraceae bacterium]|nr:PLP-dependent aspartate aminotransferase family protein [Bryobacteraceae bacterium]
MKIETKAVHAGDRKRNQKAPGAFVPVTTPIYTSASYIYESTAQLDRVLGKEEEGFCYSRYDNPTNTALEELMSALEGGHGALACSSGMMAMHVGVLAALTDRRKSILAASALYGATTSLLTKILEPLGVAINFMDVCNLDEVRQKIADSKPGCVLMETISNPLLRVGAMDRIAELARAAGAALLVDNTFATPLLVRPLELGAHLSVHSATKFLSGHGDVLGGVIIADQEHAERVRTLSRTLGPVLGPFESYLTMRGIKTFPLRMERQCSNACRIAGWLSSHPRVARVHYLADPAHPDAAVIRRLLPENLYGAVISLELKDAGKQDVFRFMDRLKLVVPGTSLGDVHSLILYPAISSHRDVAPKQRERMGIHDGLVRLCAGIEAAEDIIADLEQALA